jgi:hypothetical protein
MSGSVKNPKVITCQIRLSSNNTMFVETNTSVL